MPCGWNNAGPDNRTFHIVASAGNFGRADRFHYYNLSLASGTPVFSNGTTPQVMARPAGNHFFAPRSVRRPLLMPQVANSGCNG